MLAIIQLQMKIQSTNLANYILITKNFTLSIYIYPHNTYSLTVVFPIET